MFKNQKIKLILILVVVTFFGYLSSLSSPFFWDDQQFIVDNLDVRNFHIGRLFTQSTTSGGGITSNYYRPLTSLSFALDVKVWGLNPLPFHLVNLSLHIGAGILLFFLFNMLGMGTIPAFFLSLFFLIFPTQTEAVSYINSRGESLYSLILLGSLLCFVQALGLKFDQKKMPVTQPHLKKEQDTSLYSMMLASEYFSFLTNQGVLYVASVALYLLSILAKETALFALPLYGVIAWFYAHQHGVSWKRIAVRTQWYYFASLVGIGVSYFILRLTVLNFHNTLNFYNTPDLYSSNLSVRIFTFCKILFVYLGILLWPYPLHMERSVAYITTVFSWWVIGAIVLVGGLLWLGTYVYRQTKNLWVLFGFLWSSIFLIPVSGIIPINGLLYEHWLYLPMIGFFVMLYGTWKFIQSKKVALRKFSNILISFALLLAILYMFLTIRQNNIWSDPVVFFQYTLQFAPNSARAHNNLGNSYSMEGKYEEAAQEYIKTIKLAPLDPQGYNNLGDTYYILGQYGLAEKYLLYSLSNC